MIYLGVNIDHVATLRQARYATMLDSPNAEPNLLQAAYLAEEAGADSITVHLRADRRHIQDADVYLLKEKLNVKLNLEMGNTPEIVEIALKVLPDFVCLVPESREEITTEGGLDVPSHQAALSKTTAALKKKGIKVSFFIDPVLDHVYAAKDCGADMVELHTGNFANHFGDERKLEVARLLAAAELAHSLGIQVNAGHGLTVDNVRELFAVPHLQELNIGHSLVARSIAVGLKQSIQDMKQILTEYHAE